MRRRTQCHILILLLQYVYFIYYGVRQTRAEYCGNVSVDESLNTMFSLYEREALPSSVNILIALDVHHASILERSSSVQLLGDLRMNWRDTRLRWNSSFMDCDYVGVEAERFWLPDVVLLNGGATSGATSDPQDARLQSDGTILWIKRLQVTVPCTLQLTDWPSDVQRCHIKFGSRRHTADELEITVANTNKSTWEAGAWELVSSSGNLVTLDRGGLSYYVADWTVTLKRRSPAHSLATSAVMTAIVIQMVAAALLAPAARVPLFACIALSVTLWLVGALLRLPGAATAPLTLPLMSSLLILSCFGALSAALVQRVAHLRTAPPNFLRGLLANVAVLCKLMPNEVVWFHVFQNTEPAEGVYAWTAAAKLLDNVTLICGAFAVIIIICLYI